MAKRDEIPTPDEMAEARLGTLAPKVQSLTARVLAALRERPVASVTLESGEHGEVCQEVIRRFEAKGWRATAGSDPRESESWLRVEPK